MRVDSIRSLSFGVIATFGITAAVAQSLAAAAYRNLGSIELAKATVVRTPGPNRDLMGTLQRLERSERFYERESSWSSYPLSASRRRFVVRLKRADLYATGAHWPDALEEYDRALLMVEDSGEAHRRMGEILVYHLPHTAESLQESLRHLKRATEINPQLAYARVVYGHALMAVGRTDDAVRELEIAVSIDGNAYFETVLAGLYASTGRLTLAQDHFGRAVAIDSGRPDSWLGLATVLGRLGHRREAEAACAKGFASRPKSVEAELCRRLVQELSAGRQEATFQ